MAPVNSFSSASFMDIATCIAATSYSGPWDSLGASYGYFSGVVGVSRCIMAASCVYTLLGAISSIKTGK